MNKKEIINFVVKKSGYTKEQKKLLAAINIARQDIKNARQYFEMVNDPRLVDYAIYMEEAAKAKYIYLLNEAKKNNLKVKWTEGLEAVKIV